MYKIEFSNSSNVLEKNATEDGLTFMGIYQKAHPDLDLWKVIRQKSQQYNGDLKLVGSMLYDSAIVREMVDAFYKKEFWDKAILDEINSQQVANEIFVFGVNAGMKKAVVTAQEIIGVTADGVAGPKTVKAINAFDDTVFDSVYDQAEIEYYESIVVANPSKRIFAKGWRNRALAV